LIAKLATRDMDSALQAELREKEARFR